MKSLPCRALQALITALLAAAAPWSGAQTAEPANGLGIELAQQVRELVQAGSSAASAAASQDGRPTRVDVSVGQLDPRLRLAPCQRVEPYVPDGMRLWGKSRIGLRCTQGPSKWNVYLPITVRVFGSALVASSGLSAGSVLTAADLAPGEVDLAEDASAPLLDPAYAVGRTLTRTLSAGQSLRQSHLKARQWFAAGETVTVLAQGNGFSVAGEAQALNPGIEGQPVRVRTENGQVLTGMPIAARRVALSL